LQCCCKKRRKTGGGKTIVMRGAQEVLMRVWDLTMWGGKVSPNLRGLRFSFKGRNRAPPKGGGVPAKRIQKKLALRGGTSRICVVLLDTPTQHRELQSAGGGRENRAQKKSILVSHQSSRHAESRNTGHWWLGLRR